jgi:two-component system cell cycle sensor histidine kinase/response regulator CckA
MGGVADDALGRWLSEGGERTLDRVVGEAVDIVGLLDPDLSVRYLNRTTAGLAREALVGRSVLELVPPGYQETAEAAYREVLATGVGTRFETMFRDEGGMRIFEVRVGPLREDGDVIGLVAFTTEITDQRREDADRHRFFSLSLDLLIVATQDGRLKRVNPAFTAALGYPPGELVGVPFIDLVHADDRERTRAEFTNIVAGTPVRDFENRYLRRDGQHRVFSWRATVDPVTADVYAVARDITEQRAAESQVLHAQKMEAIGQLAGGIAHDFNNLMQAVLAHAELALTRGSPSPKVADHLREIEGAGRRAAELTKQLLMLGRRQPLRPAPLDVNARVQGVMRLLARTLPESITVELKLGRGLPTVNADPTQIDQVLVNLCVNARDAMDRGGTLTIETSAAELVPSDCDPYAWARPGPFVVLRLRDTGAGMTTEVRERLFEPFFTTKGPHRGTGLGLSTVYGIVQQHGGFVRVESAPMKGATFEVLLPADSRPAMPSEVPGPPDVAPARETILLAEDEDHVRRALVMVLEAEGFRTIAAHNGLEAVRLLRDYPEPVHLALLDVVMPELAGPDAWTELVRIRPNLRVLFASGYADTSELERLPPGAEVVPKPFRTAELLARIRKMLDD